MEWPVFSSRLTDVNGDSRADLVILSRGRDDVPGDATALVALSTGTSFGYPANPTWNVSWCAGYQVCLFGDLNGDRKTDMTAFTPNFGTLWGSLSSGAAFGGNAVWHHYFCIRGEVCAVGGVDGDSRADAIAFKPNAPGVQKGNVLVAGSTGAGFVDVRLGHGFFCIENERWLVGDVNGDRRADIACLTLLRMTGCNRGGDGVVVGTPVYRLLFVVSRSRMIGDACFAGSFRGCRDTAEAQRSEV